MPTATISDVYEVLGGADVMAPDAMIFLGSLSGETSGEVFDNNGTWEQADDGTSTFNGEPVDYLGHGTAQAGISVLGFTVPTGPERPVVAFSSGGKTYLYYPDGAPSELEQTAIVLNLTSSPYVGITPVCFAPETMIRTPVGERPICEIAGDDEVTGHDGQTHRVRWAGRRSVKIPLGISEGFSPLLPVRICMDAFGPGLPSRDTLVSQNHRLLVRGPDVELVTGEPEALVAAKFLSRRGLRVDRGCREVTYYHLLCDRHVLLLANGLPAESLLCAPADRASAGFFGDTPEPPDLPFEPAARIASRSEARVLAAR